MRTCTRARGTPTARRRTACTPKRRGSARTRGWRIPASAEWGGGWRMRVPFTVGFADVEGGVRGYADSRLAGSQRAVVRLEDRLFLGTLKQSGGR